MFGEGQITDSLEKRIYVEEKNLIQTWVSTRRANCL